MTRRQLQDARYRLRLKDRLDRRAEDDAWARHRQEAYLVAIRATVTLHADRLFELMAGRPVPARLLEAVR